MPSTVRTLLSCFLLLALAAPAWAGGTPETDDDGDGFSELEGDCDDTNPALNPADLDGDGSSTCDGDCDDDDVSLHALDEDGDGVTLCDDDVDCDDHQPYTYPEAPEYADEADNDCDGDVDEEMDEVDDDEDGQTEAEGDCDDTDAGNQDGGIEYCDLADNDCDAAVDAADDGYAGDDSDEDGDVALDCGGTDCDDRDPLVNGFDNDGDGSSSCSEIPDCDDSDPAADPQNTEEICGDGIDNDCSGGADDLDVDEDGAVSPECGGDDCNDGNPSINPGVPEEGSACIDQIDNDCDCTGDTNGDGVVCGVGDEGVDGLDDDCFAEPEAHAGVDQQDRFLGGVSVIALDGSGTEDDNADDVLTFTWTVAPREAYSGVTWELITDPASPYAYIQFHADAGTEVTEWIFDCSLSVTDGVFTSDPDGENVSVTATFFRPTFLSRINCSVSQPGTTAGLALLVFGLGLLGLRRRRV